ncbi:MAG: hypothetical protein OXI53_07060 [Nitrospira sp.]|nr:hypothetical protein [Nitrospira sp.]
MKRKIFPKEIARDMAKITMEYLAELPVEERRKRIAAGQKVIQSLKQSTASSASERHSKASVSSDTAHLPLAARGR